MAEAGKSTAKAGQIKTKAARFVSGPKIGDFFLQLATVVIGIIITFGGSALIQHRAERKEARQILEMTRDELKQNIAAVEGMKEWLTYEYCGAAALRPWIDNPLSAPVDSLAKYLKITGNPIITAKTNSLEMLKGSLEIKAIKDKAFLRNIFVAYDAVFRFSKNVALYNEHKGIAVDHYYNNLDRDMIVHVYEPSTMEDVVTQFVDMMDEPRIVRYIVETSNGNLVGSLLQEAGKLSELLVATVDMIEKEAGIPATVGKPTAN